MVAAFSQDISASLSLPCALVIYLHLWNFLKGGLRGSRGPPHRHMPDPRRVFLSDQYSWTLTRSTVSYEVSLWFPLLGRIVGKMWYLSPLQGPKFCSPTIIITITVTTFLQNIYFQLWLVTISYFIILFRTIRNWHINNCENILKFVVSI